MATTLTTENSSIAARVVDAMVDAELISYGQLSALREVSGDDASVGRELLVSGLVTAAQLESVLEKQLGIPAVDLRSYAPDEDALALVDAQLARTYRVLPLFEIEGTLTVAIGGSQDIFLLDTIGAKLGCAIDVVLGGEAAVAQAIKAHFPEQGVIAQEPARVQIDSEQPANDEDDESAQSGDADSEPVLSHSVVAQPIEGVEIALPHDLQESIAAADLPAEQAVDLDVLAVADEGRVAVLVSEILEHAVQRGASRIHLLPYKGDFFVVFRIKGRLEKVASAPLSMQRPLIEGFKHFARLDFDGTDRPALSRIHADVAGKAIVLTVSSVPTLAGQRLVVSISPKRPQPKQLAELGMSETECRALHAMVERGRGLLLVAAPVAGGRSATYYALLQHAAQVGKTVYSVERSIDYEIPAVAQVLVSPGQPIGAANYFVAGMRQDTDVMALDSVQSVEEIHLAIEAAGLGKLVIVTFAGGGVVAGVRRLLDLGAEPVSLANALTLGVGQRTVRRVCESCSTEDTSPLAVRIPGATADIAPRRGVGCSACGDTGFAGATGVFEVLPFTEPVRAKIARSASADEIASAAVAAGMRPMIASGLAKVQEGLVSVEELDRVLRFSE